MDADRLKTMYRRWLLEVWGAGRYEVADELLHEDLLDHNRMEGQPAGRAGDIWAAEMIRRAFPDLQFTADLIISDGQYVIGRWTMTGTNTGPFELFGLPPTGRPVTMTGQEVFRSDGKQFVEVWHQEMCPPCSGNSDCSHPRSSCGSLPAKAPGATDTDAELAAQSRRDGACPAELGRGGP